MILTIRTDSNQTQLSIVNPSGDQVASHTWESGRQLSRQLLAEIDRLLAGANRKQSHLTGIVVFRGPGSFTGLRIGITVANALAYGLDIPIAGGVGDSWITGPINLLSGNKFNMRQIVLPEYGAEAHITQQKK